jgi:hypothetical protein
MSKDEKLVPMDQVMQDRLNKLLDELAWYRSREPIVRAALRAIEYGMTQDPKLNALLETAVVAVRDYVAPEKSREVQAGDLDVLNGRYTISAKGDEAAYDEVFENGIYMGRAEVEK